MKLRLGTRGSDLALTQSRWVAAELAQHGVDAELVVISTSGDRSEAPSFGAIGPQGVFVREIEQALTDRRIDFAVHSYKDLPTQSPDGLAVAATPARRDVADWLLYREVDSANEAALLPLAAGARVGTSSARRQAWLRNFRPDLDVGPLRGNVPTRLKRLADGDFDAIILAGAGIERLDEASDVLTASLATLQRQRLDPEQFVPAPAQGALALQCRGTDAAIVAALAEIDDEWTRRAVDLERRVLALAEGGCESAFGAWARPSAVGFRLSVMSESDDEVTRVELEGDDASLAPIAIGALRMAAGRDQ